MMNEMERARGRPRVETDTDLGLALEMLSFRSAYFVIHLPLLSQKPQ